MNSTAIAGILFVPLILFLTVVMPMWLRLHYRESGIGKSQKTRGSELLCGGAGVLLGSNEATRLPVPELRIKPVAL